MEALKLCRFSHGCNSHNKKDARSYQVQFGPDTFFTVAANQVINHSILVVLHIFATSDVGDAVG